MTNYIKKHQLGSKINPIVSANSTVNTDNLGTSNSGALITQTPHYSPIANNTAWFEMKRKGIIPEGTNRSDFFSQPNKYLKTPKGEFAPYRYDESTKKFSKNFPFTQGSKQDFDVMKSKGLMNTGKKVSVGKIYKDGGKFDISGILSEWKK